MHKHDIELPHRIVRGRRYENTDYTYVKITHTHDDIEKHFGCPVCIAHVMEIDELKTHYYANHIETLPEQSQTTLQEEPATRQLQVTSQKKPTTGQSQVTSQEGPTTGQTQVRLQEEPTTGQQESHNSQERPRKRRLSNVLGTELMDSSCLSFPPPNHDDHLLVQDFDATTAFHKLQLSLCQHKWKLSLENHIHCAMAATHILLLSRHQYPEDLLPYFSNDNLKAINDGIDKKYGIRKLPIRDKAIANLLNMDLITTENKFKHCIINLIRKLPPVPIAEDIKELELSTRYVDPFLSGLFDDPDEGIYLRWTNEQTLEARQHEDLSNNRPDICISRLHGMTWASNLGYGEAKSAMQGGNNYSICRDLLRIGIFCKNALDAYDMESVLGLQVIGRTVTFYVLVLPSTGLYVMYELEKIKLPSCLDDLTKLIVDMPRICRVLETFNRWRFFIVAKSQTSMSPETPTQLNFIQSTSTTFEDVNECSSDQLSFDSISQSRKRRRNQSWVLAKRRGEKLQVTPSGRSVPSLSRVPRKSTLQILMNSLFQRTQTIHFSPEEWDTLTAGIIIECKFPLPIFEKPSFRQLLKYAWLNSHAETVASADTVRNRIFCRFDMELGVVKRILKAQDCTNYTENVWTSPWKVSYLGITTHWKDPIGKSKKC
ncbi:hypothetical protein INT44_005591 [Umbelopsis vinacea]|uniref:C2H2-type domain-containing protein n=1 Tax=Umbelopsis vinacea TaxID=44442 RepID=A0A8H7PYI6_9FUNG|nr:hypothetical protein INT44_005591 [Umbelopsis vinacea]